MRDYPSDLNEKDVIDLKADTWQLDMLKLNSGYNHWGVYEDSMSSTESWRGRIINETWEDFEIELDDLNVLVNFYFEVYRENKNCELCDGSGLNEATKQLEDDWYDFNNTGRKWKNSLTKVEIFALMKCGRIEDINGIKKVFDTEKNIWHTWTSGNKSKCDAPTEDEIPNPDTINNNIKHDGINRWTCVKARAKHLGIYGDCEYCNDGIEYTSDKAKLSLQLWIIHPRKGAARGVYIKNIKEEEIDSVIDFLQKGVLMMNETFDPIVNFDMNKRNDNINKILK